MKLPSPATGVFKRTFHVAICEGCGAWKLASSSMEKTRWKCPKCSDFWNDTFGWRVHYCEHAVTISRLATTPHKVYGIFPKSFRCIFLRRRIGISIDPFSKILSRHDRQILGLKMALGWKSDFSH